MTTYLICFIPRSGSSWLCRLLWSVNIGKPMEWHYPWEFEKRQEKYKKKIGGFKDTEEYWRKVQKFQGEFVGDKVGWPMIDYYLHEVGLKGDEKFIFLRRRHKIRQAISWYRAETTKKWSSFDKKNDKIDFNREEIMKKVRSIDSIEQRWETNYLLGKERIDVFYEDIVSNPLREVRRIADYVGCDIGDKRPDSDFKCLSDNITEEWIRLLSNSLGH